MELILLENILNLGNIGDKVKVKNGYGRNYLLKQGKALRYSKENLDFVNTMNELSTNGVKYAMNHFGDYTEDEFQYYSVLLRFVA